MYKAQSSHFCLLLRLLTLFSPSFTDGGGITSLSIVLLPSWKSRQQFAEGLQSCQAIIFLACAQGFTLLEGSIQ